MVKLVSVAEMQAVERAADAAGLTYAQMMENAGRGLAEAVRQRYGHLPQKSAYGLVGSGNNGGDTLVALTHLAGWGWRTSACIVRPRAKDDALLARLSQAGGEIVAGEALSEWLSAVPEQAVLLDGILGTGARLPLKAELAAALAATRQARQNSPAGWHVVAVDCPSGVDCDSGDAAPECLPAELTVTMAAVKQGLLRFPAYSLVGDLQVVGIGPLDGLPVWASLRRTVADEQRVRDILPPRPPDAHKGTFGTALIVAGSKCYTGAAWLAASAAYRVGAGLVTLAVPEPLHAALAGHLPEATWLLLPHENGFIAPPAAEVVYDNLERVTALLVGPGFGLEDATAEFMARLLGGQPAGAVGCGFDYPRSAGAAPARVVLPPLVVDADGLKLLASVPDWPTRLPPAAVLTPHPGEMSVLTGLSRADIQADRLGVAERFARSWGHVVVLKGAMTVVAAPDGQTSVIPVATPALARAGTGDVLAGLIVGLRAQGVEAFAAALAGAWLHAQAGLRAACRLGHPAAVLAGDVLASVSEVMRGLGQ